ncbi:MAG: hypothetical protein K2P25_10525 [Lachnospiraceae bacterium]|jgi:hypothetical protein|uniref:hypothetical protein n=1 Tax=Parablautia intestinalis TaxID=2320100 RepID=UPI0023C53FA1|nr:hypothetical protein [Parablautia intestinalis]MCI8614136.1 hypothetical protein [Lachnospiraceae bacterium]MDE7048395.1 hypothetical protein [Lachnospiraceae bacterium]
MTENQKLPELRGLLNGSISEWNMKRLKKTGVFILLTPIVFIIFFIIAFILYEIFGMCINHLAARRQTHALQVNLESSIPDIEFINIYWQTGNTSGTGNHVDCLSSITFSTQMPESEIKSRLSECYQFDEWSCYISETDTGDYLFYLNTSAPFADNIEGH